MICLQCGHCCIFYEVIIIDNPELGIVKGNLIEKPTGIRCKHLEGDNPGQYSCAVHDYDWYQETPCYQFAQIETKNSNCRVGEYSLKRFKEN